MQGNSEPTEHAIERCIPPIESFLRSVIQLGRFELSFSIHKNAPPASDLEAPEYVVDISGRDADLVLERHAELLNAIEYAALRAARVQDDEIGKISFDCQGWRTSRNEELRMIAQVAAERVMESAEAFALSSMSPRERRVIHLALRDHPHVRTISEGVGPDRKVMVVPINPPARGGLGVVRLSGDHSIRIATGLIKLSHPQLETQRATLGLFLEPQSGRVLDQVIVTCFRQPHSYTAEDVVEIACHGAPVVLRYLVEYCITRGARAAEPGEFTLRAFLNGRIDLTQAEAVRDLIESQTLYQARVAAQQVEGSVSARLKPQKKSLLDLIARLEAEIDFAEDDVAVIDAQEILSRLNQVRAGLEKLVEGYEYGRVVREGLTLAIVGRPNVGKSSLFNRLLKEERAIVTPMPGTTRDLVAETANVGGIPLRFVDTAGIREALDAVEKIGVERTFQAIADSDLRLLVVDGSEAWTEEDARLLRKLRPLGALLVALNKSDLPPHQSPAEIKTLVQAECSEGVSLPEVVPTSAVTGQGMGELNEKILDLAAPARGLGQEGEFITNLRHQQLIRESLRGLAKAHQAAGQRIPHEMLLLDLYDALRPIDLITGATYADDVLDIIFKTFCVGK